MVASFKLNNSQDTLSAAIALLELCTGQEDEVMLPTFSEWWAGVLKENRSSLRLKTLHGVTNIRLTDYRKILRPLLGNPALKNVITYVNPSSGLTEKYVSIKSIRLAAVKKGICK